MFGIGVRGERGARAFRAFAPVAGLLLQLCLLVLPSQAQAQTNMYGAPFHQVYGGSNGLYFSFTAAVNDTQTYLLNQYGNGASQHCYLGTYIYGDGLVGYYNGLALLAEIGYFNNGQAAYPQNGCNGAYFFHYLDIGATFYQYDVGKNAGACNCDSGNGGLPAPAVGRSGSAVLSDPINASTGNKYEQATDFTGSPWLTFRRFYNSIGSGGVVPTSLGSTWRHSFDRSLQIISSTSLNLFRPDGHFEHFQKSSGAWGADADIPDILTEKDDANGNLLGFTIFMAAVRETEVYSATGLLLSVTDSSGGTTLLTYSTTSTPATVAPQANLLLTVTDPMGRALQFSYDSFARLNTITLPDNGVLTYGYDAESNLISVKYPDTNVLKYLYNESTLTSGANLPGVLTGVIGEDGARFESTTYDGTGRATFVTYPGGAGNTTVTYGTTAGNGVTPATVTTSLGTVTTLGFQNILGALKVNGSSAICGNDCNQPWSAQTYDARGYQASTTDWDGNVTAMTHDANGLLTQQIDASGNTNERTTNTTWDTTLRVPLSRTVLNASSATVASTSWVYNTSGQPLAQCEIDPTVAAAASYTCAVAGTPPAGVRRWTYAYCTAVDTTQCPIVGLLLTRTGPRTDLTQTTGYAYYLDDTSTHRHGDLKTVTDALGHVIIFASYDGAGRITRTIDPNSTVFDFTYTPRGWLASRTVRFNADGSADTFDDATITITYTAYGAVQTITDADGVKLTYGYDAAHRLTTITDALGNVLQYTLDAAGNRTAEKTFASGSTTPSRTLSRTYNTLSQLTKVIDGLNHTVFDASASGSYDGNGNLVQSSDANGIVHQQSYDALNRLVQSIDNLNGADTATRNTTTLQSWDALDRLTKVTDPSNLITIYGYDGLGNPISLSSPDSGINHASFDVAGNLLSRTDANGITVSHSYDALDRPLSDSYVDSTLNASYHYDDPESVVSCGVYLPANPIGHLTRIVESTVTTDFCYDHRDNLTRQTQITAGYTDPTEFYFSGAGRLGGRITPDNVAVFYSYDSAGRVTSMIIPPGGSMGTGSQPVQNVTYLPFGPMTSYQLNGQTITRNYDANYALTDITSAALTLHFARDAMGNISALGNTAGASPASETYGYDPLYRLNAVTEAGGTALESYTYNPTGDRLSKTSSGTGSGAYIYATGTHQLASIGNGARVNDLDGNTTGSAIGGETFGYGYNGRNRMTVAQRNGDTVGTYSYNALGQRISKVSTFPTASTERFAYDEAGHLVSEYGTTNRDYLWLGDLPVAIVDNSTIGGVTSSTVNYITADQLGTPRAVTDSTGTLIWSWAYQGNPFGQQQPTSSTGYVLNLRYPGQYYDAETGTNYNVNRTYEPATGRYLQSDPIGLEGGESTYSYVGSQPLAFTDPQGQDVAVVIDHNSVPILGRYGGHSGVLVGNDKTGWDYYSKDGVKNGVQRDTHQTYTTLDKFWKDQGNEYDSGEVFDTPAASDEAMKNWANAHYKDEYNRFTNNCADFVYNTLKVGGIKTHPPHLEISIPNDILDGDGSRVDPNQSHHLILTPNYNPGLFQHGYW